MQLEQLNIGYHYYIINMSFSSYEGLEDIFVSHYPSMLKDAWELVEKGKIYPTDETFQLSPKYKVKSNNVKLFHRKLGIILYSNAQYLSKTKPERQLISYCDEDEDINLTACCLDMTSLKDLCIDEYSVENIQDTYNKAMEKEFKVNKRTREEKLKFLISLLEIHIDKALEQGNKQKFMKLSDKYNIIKEIFRKEISR